MALTWPWAGQDPVRWHVTGFILHALNSMLVFALARALGFSRFAACLASALFAVHATRPETVVWMADSFTLLAAFFMLLSLLLFVVSWDLSPRMAVLVRTLALPAMIAGLLSKEIVYACPLIMALTLVQRDTPSWRKRAWALSPFVAAAAGMFAYRCFLFGGIGGDVNSAAQPAVLSLGIAQTLKTVALRLWAVLFFPVNWSVPPGFTLAVMMAIYLPALLWISWRRIDRRPLILALGFVLLAAIPALQQLLIGADLSKARHLYLPSVGFCLLLAAVVEPARGRLRWAAPLAILAFNLVALSHNLSAWEATARTSKPACSAAASCLKQPADRLVVAGLPRILDGVYFFQNGFTECVQMQRAGSPVDVTLRDALLPTDASEYACVFTWDPGSDQLRRLKAVP